METVKERALPLQNSFRSLSTMDLNGKKAEVTSSSLRDCLIGKKLNKNAGEQKQANNFLLTSTGTKSKQCVGFVSKLPLQS